MSEFGVEGELPRPVEVDPVETLEVGTGMFGEWDGLGSSCRDGESQQGQKGEEGFHYCRGYAAKDGCDGDAWGPFVRSWAAKDGCDLDAERFSFAIWGAKIVDFWIFSKKNKEILLLWSSF